VSNKVHTHTNSVLQLKAKTRWIHVVKVVVKVSLEWSYHVLKLKAKRLSHSCCQSFFGMELRKEWNDIVLLRSSMETGTGMGTECQRFSKNCL
jgi:hypothetical protein